MLMRMRGPVRGKVHRNGDWTTRLSVNSLLLPSTIYVIHRRHHSSHFSFIIWLSFPLASNSFSIDCIRYICACWERFI